MWPIRRVQQPGKLPADLGDVLLDEFRFVELRRRLKGSGGLENQAKTEPLARKLGSAEEKTKAYCTKAHKLGDLSALCLSGGGIRSAAFALGVVQGLAARKILPQFDYLSTVSGGGYLGGFLTAWIQRKGYKLVSDELVGKTSPAEVRTSPLQHLRRYSSYLAPRKGLLTADTLTLIALYFRNLFLNWLILVPLVVSAILGVKIFATIAWGLPATSTAVAFLGLTAIILIGLAVLDSLRQRPGWESERFGKFEFQIYEMWPMFLGGVAASWAALEYLNLHSRPGPVGAIAGLAIMTGAIHFIAWMIAFFVSRPPDPTEISTRVTVRSAGWRIAVGTLGSITLSGVITGLVLGSSTYLISDIQNANLKAFVLLCFGPPILISAFFLGEMLHVGLTSYVKWGDGEREWLARAAGYHGRVAVSWMLIALIVFGGSYVVFALYQVDWKTLIPLGSVGGAAGIATALLSKTSATAATIRERYNTWKNWSAAAILAIVTPVFIVITVSFFSAAIDGLVASSPLSYSVVTSDSAVKYWLLGIFLVMGLTCLGASRVINTNRFSLHGVYRNRLIRAFLGASRTSGSERKANPFIDFDERDNIDLADLWPNKWPPSTLPPNLLVINCALNILATSELAWQERKALSFAFTPRSAGSGALDHGRGCFRPTNEYAEGISLGTAMTISGAAASPNMGYHSSSVLSVLLTFFNVRLGGWFGNPGAAGVDTYQKQGPLFAAKPLIQEALGLTTDDKRYVYLSDGGHFENLGLYEMVRRRCHLIIATDAGCDPDVALGDLGNAVRKISIDLNVRIEFETLKMTARNEPPTEGTYFAVAHIHYPEPQAAPGLLLYIKPGYHGSEPASVRSYAAANPIFPHEATSDQWFGESQFEAYRALGQHVIESVDDKPNQPYSTIREFVDAAAARLATPPAREKRRTAKKSVAKAGVSRTAV